MSEAIKALAVEIMKLALSKSTTEKNTVYVEYYGHVNILNIRVDKDGWKMGTKSDFAKNINLEKEDEKTLKELIEVIEYLKGMED